MESKDTLKIKNKEKKSYTQLKPKIDRKAFEEFQRNEREKNIILHKIVIIFLIIINLLMLIFFFFYKKEINNEKVERIRMYSQLSQIKSSNRKNEEEISKMQIGLYSLVDINKMGMTFVFNDREEFNFVFDKIGHEISGLKICYQSGFTSDDVLNFNKNCRAKHLLILIKTPDEYKFGAYIDNGLTDSYEGEYVVENDPKSFIFSINQKKIYYQTKSPAYKLNGNGFFTIGNNDITIPDHFYENNDKVICDFPKSYGNENDTPRELTGGVKNFDISYMEVYIIPDLI